MPEPKKLHGQTDCRAKRNQQKNNSGDEFRGRGTHVWRILYFVYV
jgi:hypothetical protein